MCLSCYDSGEDFLEKEDLSLLDVVFLDIYMEERNGIDVARILRDSGYDGFIIFSTSSADHALEGYSVQAYDYILKPYTYDVIANTLDKLSVVRMEEAPSVRIKSGRIWYKIRLHEILYVENHANYVHIYTQNSMYATRMTFKEMKEKLSSYSYFVRCDRGILVNLSNVYEIKDHLILMNNNSILPISRGNASLVNRQYLDFIFEEMEKN